MEARPEASGGAQRERDRRLSTGAFSLDRSRTSTVGIHLTDLESDAELGIYQKPTAGQSTMGPGARKVFLYDENSEFETAAPRQASCLKPKLWWLLQGSFLTFIVLLLILLSVLWYANNRWSISETSRTSAMALNAYEATSKNITRELTSMLQDRSLQLAVRYISDYVYSPVLLTRLAEGWMRPEVGLLTVENMTRNLRAMWQPFRHDFPAVSYLHYGDRLGTVLGYKRLSDENPHVYAGMIRPPRDFGLLARMCPEACPPPEEVVPGHLNSFYVDPATGDYEGRFASIAFDVENSTWFRAAEEAAGRLVWTPAWAYKTRAAIGISAVKAHYVDGQLSMVMAADIDLSFMSHFFGTITQDGRGMYAVDGNGLMVASSNGLKEVTSNGGIGHMRQLHWNETTNPMIYTVIGDLVARKGPLDRLRGHDMVFDEDLEYVYVYHVFNPDPSLHLPELTNGAWIVLSVQPKELYTAFIEQEDTRLRLAREQETAMLNSSLHAHMLLTVLLCGLISLVGAVIMIFVARAITRPLKHIWQDMRRVANLQFEDDSGPPPGLAEKEPAPPCWGGCVARGLSEPARLTGRLTDHCEVWEIAQMRDAFCHMSKGLQSFSKYMDPHVVQLLVQSKRQARLGVAKADVSVFFSDIAGFTTMAENLDPEVFLDMLGRYLDDMSGIIMDHGGIVGEFIGDAIMAWWNAPLELGSGHTALALHAALAQQQRIAELREQWCASGLPEVRVRMGLVRGTVLAGNIGSTQRMKYGLVGDSVNLASRLEGLCKYYKVGILIEEAARAAPGVEEAFYCRPLDLVAVKGRSGSTELFELVAHRAVARDAAETEEIDSFVEDFAAVHALYRAGDFGGALRAVEAYLVRWPRDTPARMMKERCEALVAQPPGEGWCPVERLNHK